MIVGRITADGTLHLTADTDTESFALRMWSEHYQRSEFDASTTATALHVEVTASVDRKGPDA
jgi:hypothetical protein